MRPHEIIEEIPTDLWPSWYGMGLVPRQHVHLLRWIGHGRSWFCDANFRWVVLVRKAPLPCPNTSLTAQVDALLLLASMFIFFVGLAMADLGSAMPTSGGLYWLVTLLR
jgi:hypothetical protein